MPLKFGLAPLLLLTLASVPGQAQPLPVGVHAVWFEGDASDREPFDRFMACLLGGSTYTAYFLGEAELGYRGSFVLPAPGATFTDDSAGQWLETQVARGALPPPLPDETPVYLLLGGAPTVVLPDACGRWSTHTLNGRPMGLALIRRTPSCWGGTEPLRNITQIGMHELTEVADALVGHWGCAGNSACRADGACADSCRNLMGLQCEGAPTQVNTGCGGRVVDGWVVQRLGHEGRDRSRCSECFACDFTPCVVPDGGTADPACVLSGDALPAPPAPPPHSEDCSSAPAPWWGALVWVLRRPRRWG